jgi:uncharacterized SAM-binding protein YcdF (DUF218 family)
MAFWLKKTVSFLLMPMSVSLVLMLAGLWLLRQRSRQALGRGLLLAGFLVLAFFSNNRVSVQLTRPLEAQYAPQPDLAPGLLPPANLARCRYIVVLGGGHGESTFLPATAKLSTFALARLVEGVRLLRLVPDARLVVSGPGDPGHPTHAAVLTQAAVALGVPADRIVKIEQARDTAEESRAVRALIGDAPVALVTSAWHMPRAAALFRQAGVDFLPCPADFLAKPDPGWHSADFLCDPESLVRSTYAVREYIGRAWIWLTGKA